MNKEWISVNQDLPGFNVDVLVWCKDSPNIKIAYIYECNWHIVIPDKECPRGKNVPHWTCLGEVVYWMSLPKVPQLEGLVSKNG